MPAAPARVTIPRGNPFSESASRTRSSEVRPARAWPSRRRPAPIVARLARSTKSRKSSPLIDSSFANASGRAGRRLVTLGQLEDVFGDVVERHLLGDRRDLVQPDLPPEPLDVIFAGVSEPAQGL